MKSFELPEGLELGVTTAATQIDGDCKNSNWYDWYLKGNIKDHTNPDSATKHRTRLEEDTELLSLLGIKEYRMGAEWSRIEPEEGVFSEHEFLKLREELKLLQSKGIRVLLTLHHFSNPMWFEKKGGFLSADAVNDFLRYVENTVRNTADLVNEYITINEPNVYATCAYFSAEMPPGHKSLLKTLKVMKTLGECHRRSYERIHKVRESMGFNDSLVSFAHHMRAFVPMNPKNPFHRFFAKISWKYFQGDMSRELLLGSKRDPGKYADFLALNYYSRTAAKGLSDGTLPGKPQNDFGWEIYPKGIVETAMELSSYLPELPIYITENGTSDISDSFRRRFIFEHLKCISESELPFKRYYHWCFVDNWEWSSGFTQRFGIVSLNLENFERKIKKSGEFYSELIKNRVIDGETLSEILKEKYKNE